MTVYFSQISRTKNAPSYLRVAPLKAYFTARFPKININKLPPIRFSGDIILNRCREFPGSKNEKIKEAQTPSPACFRVGLAGRRKSRGFFLEKESGAGDSYSVFDDQLMFPSLANTTHRPEPLLQVAASCACWRRCAYVVLCRLGEERRSEG